MDQMQMIGIGIGFGVFVILLLIIFIKSNMVLSQPNELVVIAGRRRKQKDGSVVGYRTIRGGRGFKLPLIESIARLPLTTQPIQVEIDNAMCLGMIPVTIQGRANVKLAGRAEDGMEAAIERFLNRGQDAVTKTAQQSIEGALRGVIATVSPEDANAGRLELASQVAGRAGEELGRLGIVLDFVVITEVSDKHGYLEAIGRQRNSEVKRDALIAESTANAEATEVAAAQKKRARGAEIEAETEITTIENRLAIHQANLDAEKNRKVEKAKVAGSIIRAEEEIELESRRVDLAKKREEANVVIPAEAKLKAKLLHAEGDAAKIWEEGQAMARAVEAMKEQYEDGNNHDLFLIQQLPMLLDKVTSVVADNLRIDKLTILDGGDGNGVPHHVKNLTNSAIVMLEQLKNATGIDIADLANKSGGSDPAAIPKELI